MSIGTPRITKSEFEKYSRFIEKKIGIKFPESKKSLLESRLSTHIAKKGFINFSEYFEKLLSTDQDEYEFFIDKITTHTTNFFREPVHFKYLINTGIKLINEEFGNPVINILSMGTSTGEEMYSISLILTEQKKFNGINDFCISGIDISKKALLKAKNGIFNPDSLRSIPGKYRVYFNKSDNKLEAKEILKQNMRFFILNASRKNQIFPDKYHIVFCRNTLIYFSNQKQQNIINNISNILLPGGLLFIGLSETLQSLTHDFQKQESTIYRKMK
jgi:chemotaxis protein methyltransferase CheR